MIEGTRFERVYKQSFGFGTGVEIFVDKSTGVQYIFRAEGNTGGLTVLLDAQGKPALDTTVKASE